MSKDYCIYCDKDVSYKVTTKMIEATIKKSTFKFKADIPICSECGEEMNIASYDDRIIKDGNREYHRVINPITTDEIRPPSTEGIKKALKEMMDLRSKKNRKHIK